MKAQRAVAAVLLVVALVACRSPAVGSNTPVQFTDYPDVPVPAGMERDQEHSMRLETPAFGSAVNVYRGGALDPAALADHFTQQMPSLGWRLVSRFQNASTILVFAKGDRLCLLGIGMAQGAPTLSVMVGAMGGPGTAAPLAGPPRG